MRPSAKEERSQASQSDRAAEAARLRGELIHLLLERLPEVAPDQRRAEADGLVANAAVDDPAIWRDAADTALTILDAPEFAHLFGPGSRAEVPVAAELQTPVGPARLSGRIDRLVVRAHDVLVIDYKTDARPPVSAADVPRGYITQLGAYCRALAGVFPGKIPRAFVLWTSAPALMEIPLDAACPDDGS